MTDQVEQVLQRIRDGAPMASELEEKIDGLATDAARLAAREAVAILAEAASDVAVAA